MALTRHHPVRGSWTYKDLFELPDDGRRYEIIEGVLFEMPGPTAQHVTVLVNLITLLIPILQALGGRWYPAPFDLFVPGADPVQPDLQVLLPGSRARVVGRGVEGPPDLVIEILSPSNRRHDLRTKRTLYAKAGVREYWTVDPEARTVSILVLAGDVLREHRTAGGTEPVGSPLLPAAAFPAAAVFTGLDDLDPAP